MLSEEPWLRVTVGPGEDRGHTAPCPGGISACRCHFAETVLSQTGVFPGSWLQNPGCPLALSPRI